MFQVQLSVHVLCTCIQIFLPYVKQEQELLYVMYPINYVDSEELGTK